MNVFPLWSPDGKQIFYLSIAVGKARINSVDVQMQRSFQFRKPVSLPIEIGPGNGGRPYDILPNGSQFICWNRTQLNPLAAPSSQINTVQDWLSELQKQAPVK